MEKFYDPRPSFGLTKDKMRKTEKAQGKRKEKRKRNVIELKWRKNDGLVSLAGSKSWG